MRQRVPREREFQTAFGETHAPRPGSGSHAGSSPDAPRLAAHRMDQPRPPIRPRSESASFTRRQLECLAWVQEGKSATDIGAILGLSPRTVEGHLAKVCAAFGVRTRIQAVLRAKDLGLIDGVDP